MDDAIIGERSRAADLIGIRITEARARLTKRGALLVGKARPTGDPSVQVLYAPAPLGQHRCNKYYKDGHLLLAEFVEDNTVRHYYFNRIFDIFLCFIGLCLLCSYVLDPRLLLIAALSQGLLWLVELIFF